MRRNPEKTSLRKFVPIGDRTRARCVTGAHATTCSTAVDSFENLSPHIQRGRQPHMRSIKKKSSRRPRNRNQYLNVRCIGTGCWGTSPTATQGGKWLSRKIPGDALWISAARTAWCRRPRWIVCRSEHFLGNQKWRNCWERGLDCMVGDRVGQLMHAPASF